MTEAHVDQIGDKMIEGHLTDAERSVMEAQGWRIVKRLNVWELREAPAPDAPPPLEWTFSRPEAR